MIALAGGACSGADDRDSTATTGPVGTAAAQNRACQIEGDLWRAFIALGSPEVFDLAPSEIAAAFDRRRAGVQALSKVVEDKKARDALVQLSDDFSVIDPVLEDALTQNHQGVAEIGMTWQFVVFSSTKVTVAQHDAYFRSREGAWPISRQQAACVAPRLLHPPEQDLDPDVEGGTIVYDPIGRADHGLLATSTQGGKPTTIPAPDGWADLDEATVAPDGRTIVAVARRGGAQPAVGLAIGNLVDGFTVVYESAGDELSCPRATADGRLFATQLGQDGRPNSLITVVGGVAATVDVPVAEFYCAEAFGDGGLLIGAATDDRKQWGGVARVDSGSEEAETIYTPDDCNDIISGLSPDQRSELVVQTCDDIEQSGLYVVNTTTGAAHQVVRRSSALARWSPSGEWITFGLAPLDGAPVDQVRVWLVRPDGTGLRQLTSDATSLPAWVSDELPG